MSYNYTGTPNQRLEQAQQRISADFTADNLLYHRYLREARAQETQAQVVEAPKPETVSGWTRFGETLGDFSKSVFSGLEKAFEGLLDFGASTVGVIAGWAGNEDLKKSASDWAARDLVEEQWQAARDAGLHPDFENSWINDLSETGQNIVRGVGQGIGQMLPEIALAIATSGASAGVQAGVKAANLAMLGISAAGTATEEALNTDIVDSEGNVTRPSLDRAYLYGLANGAVEIATEKLVGGVFENVTGAGLTDGIISKISKKLAGSGAFAKVVEFGLDAVGEGVEEMVSEAVSNTLKTIYNSEDGKMHWEDPNMQDVLVSGIIGSLTAATLGGGNVAIRNASKTMSIQDSLVDIDNNLKNAERRARNGKLTESDIDTIKASNDQSIEKISRRFQRADAKGREKLLSAFPQLREYLNEDGTVKTTELNEGAVEISSKQAAEAMSGSLAVSRRTEVANKLAEKNIKLAENMNATQKENMSLLVKALKLTEGKRGSKMNVVVAEHLDENAHIDGDVMYISKDRLNSKETVAKDFAHEAFHFAEGTKEYGSMTAFMAGLELDGKSLLDSALDKVKNLGYHVNSEIFDAIKNGEDLSRFDKNEVNTAISEINAKAAEKLIGDADTIERLIDTDRSLAKKVLNRIKDTVKALEAYFKGDAEELETLKVMRKAEKLYADALASSGQRYAQQRVLSEKAEIQENKRYSAKKFEFQHENFPYENESAGSEANRLATWWANLQDIEAGDQTLISYHDNWYVVEKFDDAHGKYQVEDILSQKDYYEVFKEITQNGRSGKIESIQGIANEIDKRDQSRSSPGREKPSSYSDETRHGRENIAIQSVDKESSQRRETPSNRDGNNESGSQNRQTGIKQSLREDATDSNGRKLSVKQREYFKDTKVVDDKGNLLVVYHGTPKGDFTVFRTENGAYFSSNKQYAERYAQKHIAADGRVVEAYLNIEKPFDTRNAVERKIFEEEYYKKYGSGAPLSESGLPDWTDGDDLIEFIKEKGYDYDGIMLDEGGDGGYGDSVYKRGISYVIFDPEQAKLISNESPTNNPDIRYSLRDEIRTDDKKARRLLLKRIEGLQLDNRGRYYAVADESMFADDEKGDHLMNQIRLMTDQDEMIRQKYANDLAISIVNNLCVTDVDPQLLDDLTKQAAAVNDYRRKINLSSIKGEINSKYGNKNSIFLQWHNPNGISVDDAIMELRSQGIDVDDNNIADGFFDMLDIVDDAKRATDKVLSKKAKDLLSPDEYDTLVDELREDIISFMDEHTSAKEVENYYKNVKREADLIVDNARQKAANIEKLATLEADLERAKASEEFKEKVAELEAEKKRITEEEHIRATNEIADVQTRHILVDKIWGESQAFTADNLKKFKNMSELRDETFEKGVKPLGAIRFRGELKKFGMRKKMVEFAKWYSVENQLLTGGLSEDEIAELKADPNSAFIGYLDKTALEALDYLTSQMMVEGKNGSMIENHKALTNKELQALRIVLGAARQLLKEYNAIQIHGKTLVLTEEATAANTRAAQVSGIVRKKVGVADKAAGLARMMMRPDAVISEMMGGEDNAFSQLYKDIQKGESHAHYIKLELDKMINDFFKDHKSYKKRLSSETVKIGDHEIKLESAISLYMLAQQQHSVDGLEASGWGCRDSKGYWVDCGQFTLQDQLALEKVMTAEDKQFVRTLRKFFNKAAEYQIETDKKYRGYSLIEENGDSDYFPIKRYGGDMAKAVQDNDAQNTNTVSVANYSINKERVANKHRIDVIPVTRVLEQHSKQVSMYSGLAPAIKEFQRLYNCNIGKEGKVVSIRNTINEKSWNGFNSYLTDLLQDIQGVPRESGSVNKALNTLRGHYATFQLGFNIKTILSQVAGYPAILPYVHPSSMLKAFTHGLGKGCYNNMISNCEWAAVKCQEGGVVLAETATEKLNAFGKVATAGVEWMDTQLNKMIWNACQCEVERLHKGDPEYRFGTEKNMKAAAELHAEVGRKTQGNSAKSEGTAMQRSSNVIIKGLSMFNSDGFKMVSCLYEGITKARALHELEKQGVKVDPKAKTQAKQYIAKSATSILASTMVYCAVAELMKFALNKDRNKDKEGNEMGVLQDYGMEMLSQLVGMVPVVRDIYSMIVEGFDVDNFATSGFTDLAKSMSEGFQSIIGLAQDEKQTSSDYAAPIKKIIDSLGQITGIPTRNVYNYVYGAVKRFDESAAYKWSDFVYGNSYSKDLTKAMQEGDEKLAGTIIGLMMKNDGMTDTSTKVNDTLRTLHSQGYTVLPKAVGDSFSFDGETYSMSGKQVTAFKSIYGKANKEVEELIASAGFSALDGSVQAKSIRWIYDYYYENAIYHIVGEEADTKRQLFGETMDISKFAMTIAACNAVESKLDKKGNVIAGSKKAAVEKLLNRLRLTQSEKLMILAYLGYSVEDSERVIKNYISRLGLSKSQQRALLNYCGLTA